MPTTLKGLGTGSRATDTVSTEDSSQEHSGSLELLQYLALALRAAEKGKKRDVIIYLKEAISLLSTTIARGPRKEYHTSAPHGRKSEGILKNEIIKLLRRTNVPSDKWDETAAEIERTIKKTKVTEVSRPKWDDRSKHRELAELSAPEFLKKVWADQFDQNGGIRSDVVGQHDQTLLNAISWYISARRKFKKDLGDAEGIHLIKKARGRPQSRAGLTNM